MPEKIHPKVLSWASDLEPDTSEQAARLSRLPFIHQHVALMPDAHLGKGATVGSVIATEDAVVPAAVGVDLGCGMLAVRTTLTRTDLSTERLEGVLTYLKAFVPAGVGEGQSEDGAAKRRRGTLEVLYHLHLARGRREGDPSSPRLHRDLKPGRPLFSLAESQLGTLGSGNHFLEVHVDESERVWAVVHSGSRGVGNKLAVAHIKEALSRTKKWFIELEDPDLAYIPGGTEHFGRYLADVRFAQDYAWLNRIEMMRQALIALGDHDTLADGGWDTMNSMGLNYVHCHHNYMEKENHMGRNLWVTRKGAVRAREGDLSVLPGSMGTFSYIVKGLGNPASFMSAPHGAGRRLSRSRARKELDLAKMREMMADRVWLNDDAEALLDEHPDAYKDINMVLEDSKDLVKVVHTLSPVLNFKGL